MSFTRNTKKSRLVSEFADCVVNMVLDDITAPSKSQIVDCVAEASLGSGVSTAIKTMLEDELANELERYFPDVCKVAQEQLDMPYHLVNAKYYKRKKPMPDSKEQARSEVATFANGRTGKAQGVRFVTDNESVDIFLAIVAEKRIDTSNAVVQHTREFVTNAVNKGALPNDAKNRITSGK